MAQYFGRQILPGVVSLVDSSALSAQGQRAYGVLGIVGLANYGTEDLVYQFNSSAEAKRVLQGGQMLDAILAAFSNSAQRILAVRCGAPVAASALVAGPSSNADSVTLTAKQKGTAGNNIQWKVELGSGGASHRILLLRKVDDYENIVETWDNGGAGVGFSTKALLLAAVNAASTGSNLVTMAVDVTVDVPEVTSSWANFTSGTSGTRSNQEISDALDLLLPQKVDIVMLDDSTTTYHALLSAHCDEASNVVNKSRRTGVVGMPVSQTSSNYVTQASAIGNKRIVVAGENFKTPDFAVGSQSSSLKAGYISAAMMAGRKAGLNDPAEPLTGKTLSYALEAEHNWNNTDLELLVNGKVAAVALRRNGYRVIKQVTTSADTDWSEWSVVTSVDFIQGDLEELMEELFIGRKGTNDILTLIENTTKSRLSLYVEQGILFEFFKDSVKAKFLDNDQTFIVVEFSCVPIFPVNNIGISIAVGTVFNFNLNLSQPLAA